MLKNLIIFLIVLQSLSAVSQSFWEIENEHNDEILLTIDLNASNGTFEAYTRKNALKDIAGTFTYTLAKTAGKLRHAEIVFIDGKASRKGDSLTLIGTFNYFDKQYPFSASISGNSFKGRYTDTKNKSHGLIGIKVPDNKPLKNYPSIINSAFSVAEKYLCYASWLKSSEWLDFKEKISELKPKIADDYELAASFFWLSKKLPFSPFTISKFNSTENLKRAKNKASVRELTAQAALLEPNTLPSTKSEMDSLASVIDKRGYSKLIIDLRGNYRNNPFVAKELVNYISSKKLDVGVYLTRKWFDANHRPPGLQECQKVFENFSGANYTNGDLSKGTGENLKIIPRSKTFKGKVYVLTDSKTSKVFEALVYTLKNESIATIVGQKTAGALLLSEKFIINNEYELVLPVADYFTCDGRSLEKIGVEPDVKLSGEDALKYILKSF